MKKRLFFLFFFLVSLLFAEESPFGVWYDNTPEGWSVFAKKSYAITDKEFKLRNNSAKLQTVYPYIVIDDYIVLSSPTSVVSQKHPQMKEMKFKFERNGSFMVFHLSSKDEHLVLADQINNTKTALEAVGVCLIAVGAYLYVDGTIIDRNKIKSNVPIEPYMGESDGKKLARNMCAAYNCKQPKGTQAHHIVPKKMDSVDARVCREILKEAKIDLNDPHNGVFLPTDLDNAIKVGAWEHIGSGGYVHSNKFLAGLAQKMMAARGNQKDIYQVLDMASKKLLFRESW